MSNYLTGGRVVNIGLLQESATRNLICLLDKCNGPKVNTYFTFSLNSIPPNLFTYNISHLCLSFLKYAQAILIYSHICLLSKPFLYYLLLIHSFLNLFSLFTTHIHLTILISAKFILFFYFPIHCLSVL